MYAFQFGLLKQLSQRNAKIAKRIKCVHLSKKGICQSGNPFEGTKHNTKMSKVQSMAKDFARLYKNKMN